jgi:hypothetical protein
VALVSALPFEWVNALAEAAATKETRSLATGANVSVAGAREGGSDVA